VGIGVGVNTANDERVLAVHAVHAVRSGRADRTVTRHLSQAGSYQVTPPDPTTLMGDQARPA
jgi:hypothetical protein